MNAFEYVTTESFDAAAAFLSGQKPGEALLKSGGVDVVDRLKERLETPKRVVNLLSARTAGEKIRVDRRAGALLIPALSTLAELAEHAEVRERFPALAAGAGEAATPQVRNTATVGGNLCQKPRCWYYRSQDFDCLKKGGPTCYAQHGDNRYHAIFGASACHIVHPSNIAVPLLGQGASLRLVRSQHGKRVERTVSLDEFFRVPISPRDDENVLGRGELVREVLVPLTGAGKRAAYLEAREKQSFDWPLVSCAVNLNEPSKPRVVLGAVAPIPWRLEKVEKLIAGRQLSDAVVERAKNAAMDGALPMSHNGYKVRLVGALVEQALRQARAG